MNQKQNQNIKNIIASTLAMPVLICFVIGLVFAITQGAQGVFLIGVALCLAVINFLIAKIIMRKLDESPDDG